MGTTRGEINSSVNVIFQQTVLSDKLTVIFAICLSYYIVASTNIKAFSKLIPLPQEGIYTKQLQLPPDGLKLLFCSPYIDDL